MQIYDTAESEIKLNDIFEFVRILTFDPELPVDIVDSDDIAQSICEEEVVHLPLSNVFFFSICYFALVHSVLE